MPDQVSASSETARLDARSPFDPAQLRPDFQDPAWWIANAPRFSAFAAYAAAHRGLSPAQNVMSFVATAITFILDGERLCPDHESSLIFVFLTIDEVIAGWLAASPVEDSSPVIAPRTCSADRERGGEPISGGKENGARDTPSIKQIDELPERDAGMVVASCLP